MYCMDLNLLRVVQISRNLYVFGAAKDLAHYEDKRVTPIMSEMCSGTDYYKLVKVFEKHFGHFVVLETNNQELLEYIS